MKKILSLTLAIAFSSILSLNNINIGYVKAAVKITPVVSKSKSIAPENQTTLTIKPVNDFRVVRRTDTTVEFKWTQLLDSTNIKIKQSLNNGKTWSDSEIDILNPNSAKITSLKANTLYRFKLAITIGKSVSASNIVVCKTNISKSKDDNKKPIVSVNGNSNGNIANGGYVAQEGDWIYYGDGYNNKIYKVKMDGTNRTKLSDHEGYYINVLNGWVYYVDYSDKHKVCKMKIDGSKKTQLTTDASSQIHVIGDWIYYNNQKGIAKMKTNGSCKTQLNYDSAEYINVVGDWIYYFNDASDISERGIFKIKTDGSDRAELSEDGSSINVAGNWIYYLNKEDNNKLYKMKTDATEKTKLTSYTINIINVVGDWIYYEYDNNNKQAFAKMKTDGTNETDLIYDKGVNVNVLGNWIYYLREFGSRYKIYKMKTDGSGLKNVQ
jgi:hypothetical protein